MKVNLSSVFVAEIRREHVGLRARGVAFTTDMDPVALAVLDGICGNLIQIHQMRS